MLMACISLRDIFMSGLMEGLSIAILALAEKRTVKFSR
jgi:hypothetical protein